MTGGSRLLLASLTILVASIISSTLLYGLFANSLPALIATGVLVIFLIGLIPLRRRSPRLFASFNLSRFGSMTGPSTRELKIGIVVAVYFLLAGGPVVQSYFDVVPGVARPWTPDVILLSFGVWAIIFAFFYGVYWVLDALVAWRRSLRIKQELGSNG